MDTSETRRDVLKGLAALGAAGVTSGVGLSFAQGRAVSATTFPGAWEEAHRSILVPAYRKATDNAGANLVAALAVETVSKLVAAKANPPYDAVILDEGPFIAAIQHDIFEKLPADKVPHLKDLPQKFVDPRGLGAYCSAQIFGIA
jgi:putative spermidine/putrescine transport system substrate-binding protein